MENNNITPIKFTCNYASIYLWQWDTGQVLSFSDIPDGVEVQFEDGSAKVITDGKITVPDAFLQTAGEKHAWLQFITADAETTFFLINILVKKRAKKDDYVPEDPQTFREWMQETMEATESIAQSVRNDADSGVFDGSDGFSPTVTVTEIEGGHRVTITDKSGDHSFDVLDGGGGGTDDHSRLTHRSDDDQHPMSAITGLSSALAGKQPVGDYALRSELPSVAGLASESWVQSQGYLTQHQDISGKADTSYVESEISRVEGEIPSLSGYATEAYVDSHHDSQKQDAISDLSAIRSGAALGATAVQPSDIAGMATETYVDTAIATAIAGVDDLIGSGVV